MGTSRTTSAKKNFSFRLGSLLVMNNTQKISQMLKSVIFLKFFLANLQKKIIVIERV